MHSINWLSVLLLAIAWSAQGTVMLAEVQPRKRNVLLIISDDLNNCLGCYGHPVVKTPHIDRLAQRGLRFERAYCQYPLCNPSRTSFLSGRRPATTRVMDNETPPRTNLRDVLFLPEYFAKFGYFTAGMGKVFHGPFLNSVKWNVVEAVPAPKGKQPTHRGNGSVGWQATENRDEDEPDGKTARHAARLLEQNKDKPFFIAAGFYRPHLPFVVPRRYFDMYPADRIVLPEDPAEHLKKVPPPALMTSRDGASLNREQRQEAIAAYFASISFVDAQVGVLLEAMDRLKLWDNTVVAFIGDHGWLLSEHGNLWGKPSLFENCARVPMIIAAPGKQGRAVSHGLVELVDLYATLADLAGLPAPDTEGTSMAPLLGNPSRFWKRAAFTTVRRDPGVLGRSVRTERHRYTEWGDEKAAELYDYQADPHEFQNLVHDPRQADTLSNMRHILRTGWQAALPATKDMR